MSAPASCAMRGELGRVGEVCRAVGDVAQHHDRGLGPTASRELLGASRPTSESTSIQRTLPPRSSAMPSTQVAVGGEVVGVDDDLAPRAGRAASCASNAARMSL